MNKAVIFKALQRSLGFRNPESILQITSDLTAKLSPQELLLAERYLLSLRDKGIKYTYPGHEAYPLSFYKMLEPPLFLEYLGEPVWLHHDVLAVVGSRKMHSFTQRWLQQELPAFLEAKPNVAIASGGAMGVDQCAHWAAVKSSRPTIVVLPCGIDNLFPQNLNKLKKYILDSGGCFLSEFESEQQVRKHFFFFRNRLITNLSSVTMIAQAERKSGSFLTVHHALQNGRMMVTLPAHPEMSDFSGNLHLMREGCFYVLTNKDLLNFWEAESWSGRGLTLDMGRI
ncbi:DNA-processing protein DprA [Pseudobdellovibrio sp. HCB154]|uniref:DNA-processing protein DprA n=1 Tax=Pseudobdellovibrio sp. HCB154 TaxID=3386277 RepID=UPI003917507F